MSGCQAIHARSLIAMSQVTTGGVFSISTLASGSNVQGTIVFALPVLIGVIGIFAFLLLGVLLIRLIRLYTKEPQVNTTCYTILCAIIR